MTVDQQELPFAFELVELRWDGRAVVRGVRGCSASWLAVDGQAIEHTSMPLPVDVLEVPRVPAHKVFGGEPGAVPGQAVAEETVMRLLVLAARTWPFEQEPVRVVVFRWARHPQVVPAVAAAVGVVLLGPVPEGTTGWQS